MNPDRRIIIIRSDFDRLQRLVEQNEGGKLAELAEQLDTELSRAEIHEEAPPDVVTMNSTVVFEDEESGERREATLCYPHEVTAGPARVSVLAPIGCALLGLSVGQTIEWPVPGGRLRRLRIVAIPHQERARLSA